MSHHQARTMHSPHHHLQIGCLQEVDLSFVCDIQLPIDLICYRRFMCRACMGRFWHCVAYHSGNKFETADSSAGNQIS